MVALSRSARLASWGNAWFAGTTSLDEADERIRADDAAHHVVGLPGEPDAVTVLLALGALRRAGTTGFSLALPAPGDPLGLAGPSEFTRTAMEAGEAVVCDGAGLGLVPNIVGEGVQWSVHTAQPAAPMSFSEASTELIEALQHSIEVLSGMEIARWRADVAEALADLRRTNVRGDNGLPPGYAPRADQLAARARTCLFICDLVLDNDGGARTAYEADVGNAVLRRLERAARRGLVAACAPPR